MERQWADQTPFNDMKDLNIVYLQTDIVWQDRDANIQHYDDLIEGINADVDLVLLPETFNTAFPVDAYGFAEKRDGATMQWMKSVARKKGAVVAGTLLLDDPDGYYNTFVWMCPDGSFQTYRKRHTFALGGEGSPIGRGDSRLIVELEGWRIMPLVCYDLRFPIWSRNSFTDNRFAYDVLVYVANFPDSRMAVWDTLLKARAIENQAYVVAVNRVGTTPDETYYSGHSQVIDSRGDVVCSAQNGKDEALVSTLSADALAAFRKKFAVAADWD